MEQSGTCRDTTADLLGFTAEGRSLVRVACAVELGANEAVPEWIHIVPGGPLIVARDKRSFRFTKAERVLKQTELPMLLDWEHDSERPHGRSRAAGWVEELRYQDSDEGEFPRAGIWGRVRWTPEGESDVRNRVYRYLSPVLLLDKDREVSQLLSVALTNVPALRMHAVQKFREQFTARFGRLTNGETMNEETVKALCSVLGLAEDADESSIIEAVKAVPQLRAQCSQLTEALTAATERAACAEGKVAELERAQFAAEVDQAIEQASRDGKVTPATAPGYRELCMKGRDSFDLFSKTILPALPKLCGDAPKVAQLSEERAASADEEELVRLGLSREEIAAARKEIATRTPRSED